MKITEKDIDMLEWCKLRDCGDLGKDPAEMTAYGKNILTIFRLARIGLWADDNRDAIIESLCLIKWGGCEITFLEPDELAEIDKKVNIALNNGFWSRE